MIVLLMIAAVGHNGTDPMRAGDRPRSRDRRRAHTMLSIFDVLPKDLPTINITNVGALSLGEGTDYPNEPYVSLLARGAARVIGFEPDKHECDRLNRMGGRSGAYLPYVIGDGTAGVFRTCRMAMSSSLYEPNAPLLAKFQQLDALTEVVNRSPVQTRPL